MLKLVEDGKRAGLLAGSAAQVSVLCAMMKWCGSDERFGGVNNVATTAAAVTAYASVAAFGLPELLLSCGTAGGFSSAGASVRMPASAI